MSSKKADPSEIPIYEISKKEQRNITIRKVKPYIQAFETFAKGRWLGRTIYDVLSNEFGGHSPVYWKNAITSGCIKINNNPVSELYKFRNGDKMLHITHR